MVGSGVRQNRLSPFVPCSLLVLGIAPLPHRGCVAICLKIRRRKLVITILGVVMAGTAGTPGYCPVITVGGSYPGFLSAMMRVRYADSPQPVQCM